MTAIDTDYVVIGAGSAGCVIASRLSETGARVILLEAGPRDWHPMIHIPAGVLKLLHHPVINWNYSAGAGPGTANRPIHWPRGKVLGGSSSINGMLYVRGNPADFDGWAQMGCRGWSFDDVLPYFRKSEHYVQGGDSEYRGKDGPLKVEDYRTILPLTHRFVHHDGAGDRDVQRGHLACHRDAQEMVAGLLHQVVQSCAFASEDEDAIGPEVEVGVVRRSALVEAEDPDMLPFHLLQRPHEVGDASDPHMFGRSCGRLGYRRGDRCRTSLRQDDTVYACSIGGAQQSTQIMGIFDAIESKEEFVLSRLFGGEQVFDPEKLALAHDRQHSLMRIGAGEPGELVARLKGYANACGAAEFDQPFEAVIATLAGDTDVVELARAGTDGLFNRVKPVKNFHPPSLLPRCAGEEERRASEAVMNFLSFFRGVPQAVPLPLPISPKVF